MVVSYTTSPLVGVNACRCAVVSLFIVNPLTVVDENVNAVALALPRIGVTNVGDVANTFTPVPVSSVNAAPSCADVNEPSTAALPTDVM